MGQLFQGVFYHKNPEKFNHSSLMEFDELFMEGGWNVYLHTIAHCLDIYLLDIH